MMTMSYFKRYSVFGWNVFKREIKKGEKYTVSFWLERDNASLGLMTMWVKGRISGMNTTTGVISPERVAGSFTGDRNFKYAPGRYEYLCEEDSEWWCIPYFANSESVPNATAIRLSANESLNLPANQRAIIFYGDASLNGTPIAEYPSAISSPTDSVISANAPTYGFLIDREK